MMGYNIAYRLQRDASMKKRRITLSLCLLLAVAFLSGCDPPQHNYLIYSDPARGTFKVDSVTGDTWQFRQLPNGSSSFVEIPSVLRMEQVPHVYEALRASNVRPVLYLEKGVLYEVLLSKNDDFRKIHPDALKIDSFSDLNVMIGNKIYAYNGFGVPESLKDFYEIKPLITKNNDGHVMSSYDNGQTWMLAAGVTPAKYLSRHGTGRSTILIP